MDGGGAGGGGGGAALEGRVREVLLQTVELLRESGARSEALAEFVQRKAILGIARSPVMVPKGRVWRLGVLLLDEDGGLHTVGTVTRAVDPGRVTNQSERAEIRRDHRRAAFHAKFAEGDTVNFDTTPVPLDAASIMGSGPGAGERMLALGDDGTVLVRWNLQAGSTGYAPLESYLRERAELLTAPPP
ncbi:hypothetical protein [Herbiconiux liukaitaii]|uniref:hypothetical protein n=1 Tax=Herbiconiux liukaitaii TaxID=3342799 RepID=UPI0035B8A08F